MILTKAERAMLLSAEKWEGEGCGVHHAGYGARSSMLHRMEAKGLLKFEGFGPDAVEGWGPNSDREYPIWVLAPAGYDALEAIRATEKS